MEKSDIPASPLNRIALSCSGGGYRAASFHLGAMSYLNSLPFRGRPLLENVRMISTVSGGTITGVIYALMKQQDRSFDDFYRFLIEKLRSTDLVTQGLEKLNPGTVWDNPFRRKNLINAFAEIYDREFTGGATFAVFGKMNSHLETVVFNSTEFDHGIDFRFRNKGSGFFGNHYYPVPEKCAREVRLADAIASSSCFPGGFEPMVWPHDYVHPGSPELKSYASNTRGVGIMDGGIYDNQGVDSILGFRKNEENPWFDLVIISDVASPYIHPFAPSPDQPKEGFRKWTLQSLMHRVKNRNRLINWVLTVIILTGALLPACWDYENNLWTGISLGFGLAAALLATLKWRLVRWGMKKVAHLDGLLKQVIPPYFLERFKRLKYREISIRRIEPMLLDRVNSLVVLLSSVFLKVVRKLNYGNLYEDDRYRYRRVSNLIRELTEADYLLRMRRKSSDHTEETLPEGRGILHGTYRDVVGLKIKAVAEEAAGFGTTLWFTDRDHVGGMLDKLVAAGQFTLCYNLVEYLEKIMYENESGFAKLDPETRDEIVALYERCCDDWRHFRDDPMYRVVGRTA